jgi:hypothetical protein
MENEYKTSDLGLAVYLVHRGYIIKRLEQVNGSQKREIVFYLKRGMRIEDEATKFNSGEAQVSPRRYFDDVKYVKNYIYNYNPQKYDTVSKRP